MHYIPPRLSCDSASHIPKSDRSVSLDGVKPAEGAVCNLTFISMHFGFQMPLLPLKMCIKRKCLSRYGPFIRSSPGQFGKGQLRDHEW